MSAIPTRVQVFEGQTWTEVVAPVGVDSIVVMQQERSQFAYEFTFATGAPALDAPAFQTRPEMGAEWVSWNVDAGQGIWARHYTRGVVNLIVSVEDA